jgi:uncharacterized protein (TIGR00369 family)
MQNPDGLRIHWTVEGTVMTGEFTPEKKYQGWKGIVHGGIIATLLDEAMTRLAVVLYGSAVTAEMTVHYHSPAKIGEPIFIRGELVSQRRRLIEMKASLQTGSGREIASSTGKALQVRTSK